MPWRNPNTVGQIYRFPEMTGDLEQRYAQARLREGDLIVCLELTGDCHYVWGRLEHTGTTVSPSHELAAEAIRKHYRIDCIFSAYAVIEEWGILKTPMTHKQLIHALVAKPAGGGSGILLPLTREEKVEYLRRRKEIAEMSSSQMTYEGHTSDLVAQIRPGDLVLNE